MWCGDPEKHDAHDWGRWLQHACRGKGGFSWFVPHEHTPSATALEEDVPVSP